MASTYPTTPKGHRTRSQILTAASEVFTRDGYVSAGMVDIADHAGLSMGGLYRYFASKEELFGVLAREHLDLLLQTLEGAWDQLSVDAAAGVRDVNRAMVGFWAQHAGLSRVLDEAAAVDADHLDAVEATRAKAVAGISRRLVVAGRVSTERPLPRLVDLLLGMTARAARQVADDPALSEDPTVDLMVDLWSSALFRPDPERSE